MNIQCASEFSNGPLCTAWNRLLSEAGHANAQLTYEWSSSCWEVFGGRKRLSLITAVDGAKVVGIAPLVVTKVIDKAGLRLRKLTFVGDGLTDYHDLLIADDKREAIVRAILKFVVNGRKDWDVVHLRNIRADSPNLPILRDTLRETSLNVLERVNIRSPYIAMDRSWADYCNSLGKNIRSDIRRRLNRLAKAGKAEFVRLHDVDDVMDTLDVIKSIHVKCRAARGESSWYRDEDRARFVSLILKRFGDRKWLDMVFLKLNGRVIAYYLGFVYDHIVYFWNTGFDPEFSRLSPGKLLLHYWIKDSFAQGCREFDFMVGEEPYKLQWTNPVRPNHELFVFRNTTRARLLKCYYTCKPALKKNRCLRRIATRIKRQIKD